MTEVKCCLKCQRKPDEIQEYVDLAADDGVTPERFVKTGEGTFDPRTGYFWCTDCYIKLGMPLGKARAI